MAVRAASGALLHNPVLGLEPPGNGIDGIDVHVVYGYPVANIVRYRYLTHLHQLNAFETEGAPSATVRFTAFLQVQTGIHRDRHTYIQIDRQTYRYRDIPMEKLTDGLTSIHIGRHASRKTDTYRYTHRHTDIHTNMQTDGHY